MKKLNLKHKPTLRLTDEQVEFFKREGYLAIPAITTPEEVEKLIKIYDRLFEEKAGRERGDHFDLGGTDDDDKTPVLPQILNPMRYAPELEDTQALANAAAIAKQILGPEAEFAFDHAILKPAQHGSVTPWHQDEAYSLATADYTTTNIWIPLQPATLENGCMQFIPGSHKLEVLPHHPINHDPRVHGLECDLSPDMLAKAVPCPLPPGGATMHVNRTLHYAGPNRSNIPRRAYILNFATPQIPRAVPKDFPWNKIRETPRDVRAKAAGGHVTKT